MSSFAETIEPLKPFAYQSGDRYGLLMLTGKSYVKGLGDKARRFLECLCDCGSLSYRPLYVLKRSKSCGCLTSELISQAKTIHGKSSRTKDVDSRLYWVWAAMKDRCYNENSPQYKDYGGRGIFVCEEWKNDFLTFQEWALSNGWKQGLTLERNNVDGIYSPTNCSFVTMKKQNRNKRNTKWVTLFGEIKCLAAWFEDERISIVSWEYYKRIEVLGETPEQALSFKSLNN